MSLWGIVSLIIILSFPATGYGQNRTVDHQFEAYKYGNQFIDFDSTKSSSIQVISGAELGPDAVPSELVDGVVQNYIPSTSRFNSDSRNKAIIQNQDELSQYEIKVDKEIIHLSKDSSTQEGKFHVWLSGSPSNPVKISFEIDHSIIRFLPSGLIFDKANFDEKQKVAVYGVEDHLPTFGSQIITITAFDLGLEEHAKGADETSKFRTIRLEHMDHGKANDDPELIYEMETFYVEEGKTNEDFEVRIGGESPPSEPVTVTVTVTDNTEDLSLVTVGTKVTQLIFPPIPTPSDWFWNNPQFVTVIAKRDRDDINDSGTIKVEASGGGFDGLGGDVDIVILDNNDAPNPSVVSFHSPQSMTTELAGGIFPIRVNIDPSTEIGFILMYSVSGTASQTRPVDYQIPRSVTVPPNSDKVNIPVTVVGDPFPENDETVIITLTSTDDYQVGQPNVHTLTITDSSDQPDRPLINFINTSSSVTENDIETHNVEITIVSPSSSDLTLNYSIDGTATAGGDYTIPQSVTMNANATSVNIPIDVIDDQEVEDPDETIILTFSDNEEYDLGNIRRHTVTIIDDDVRIPVVNFTSSASSEEEDAITHNVNLIIDPPSTSSFALNYNIGGNATPNQDYTSPQSVTINANDTSVNIPVDIIDDTIIEDPETVIFTLIDGPEYDIGTSSEYVLTIIDDDLEATPVVGFSERELRANEADGQVMLDVYVRPASTSDFILRYRLGGTATRAMDYRANESVRVPANASSVKIPIEIIDDEVIEDLESITLTFIEDDHYDLSPFDPMFTVIITDNDYPEVAFDFAESTAPENKPRHEIKINIDPAPREMFTLNYRYNRNSTATFNKDFFISDLRGFFGQIDIAENTSSTAIEIEIIDDQIFESDETVILTLLGNEVGVINQHTLTIIDDDDIALPIISIYPNEADEDDEEINLTVSLDRPSDDVVIVGYEDQQGSAKRRSDYNASSGLVIFDPGATSGVIQLTLIDDTQSEENEVFQVQLQNPRHAIISEEHKIADATIIDNDHQAKIRIDDAIASEDATEIIFQVSLSQPSTQLITLQYQTEDGSATSGEDYAAVSGIVNFAPGRVVTAISVPLLLVDMDQIEKTFLVHLMSPESVPMDKSTAVATITESEDIISNILRNYTARFIRTSSIHVVEALQERLRPSPSACAAKERSDMARLWHNASTLEPTLGELLSDCRISQSITTKTKKTFSIWGRGAYRQFQGRGQEIRSLRGNVTSGLLGADYQWNSNWMVGVMLARHQGDGSFDINQESGDIQSALSAVYPYLTYINSEIEIWLSGGLGQGHTQINPNIDQNLTSRFGAAGLQGHLMTLKPMKFQYYGDVLLTDATFSSTDLRAHVFRVRLGLEGALHISELIHPYVEASVRQDGGSAENGFGMEMGGGVRVTVPQWNLRGNLRSQGLIMHTAEGFTEWGFSGAIQIGQASQGFMASLRPSWGASRGGILYHQQTLLHVGTLQQGQHQTEIELRYAIPLQHGILSSIMGITEYAYGRSFRLGGELRPRKQFRLSLSGLAHQKSTTVGNFGVNMTGLIQY